MLILKPAPSGSIIKMGNTPHSIQGIGTVMFYITDSPMLKKTTLFNTLSVCTIGRNLISMSKIDKAGLRAKLVFN